MTTAKENETFTRKLITGFIKLFGKSYGEPLLKEGRKKSKLFTETSSSQIKSEPPEG